MTTDPWYGRDLAGYRVGDELGTALGGELYAAQQLARGRPVILKIVDATVSVASGFRGRFERDAALLGSFFHPHVVTLYGAGTVEGTSFLAMRPDDDPTLEELIGEAGALDTPRATALVAQVASGLDAVHQRGLVHRGLSPASILVRAGDGGAQAAITDFVVADDTAGYGGLFEPPVGTAPPPIDYASPEQVLGEPTTPASDLYALGAILFHALTGFPPYSDLPRGATLEAHLNEPVPRATALVFDLAPSFDDLFARALAKRPADRFASAAELVAAIPAAERAAPRRAAAAVNAPRRATPMSRYAPPPAAPPDGGGAPPVASPTEPAPSPAAPPAGGGAPPTARPTEPAPSPAALPDGGGAPPVARPAEPASASSGAALAPSVPPSGGSADAAPAPGVPPSGGSADAAPAPGVPPPGAPAEVPAPAPGAASSARPAAPADDPQPAFHFLDEDGYDARAGSANYGPEEPDFDPADATDPDPAATQAFDAALADAVDIDEVDLDIDDAELDHPDLDDRDDEDDDASPQPDADPELDALLAAAAAPAEPAAAAPARRGIRAGRRRGPPDVEPIEGIDSPPPGRRRRRGRRPGVALIASGLLLLIAGLCVLVAGGALDGDGDGDTSKATTSAGAKRTEADALAELRGDTTAAPPAAAPATPPPPAAQDTTPTPAGGAPASVASWPAGRRGYTAVVFTSPTDRATARERARQASGLGLESGVLRSDDYANLEPGVWVAFAGVAATEAGAERAVREVRKAGLAAEPYVRRIDPR